MNHYFITAILALNKYKLRGLGEVFQMTSSSLSNLNIDQTKTLAVSAIVLYYLQGTIADIRITTIITTKRNPQSRQQLRQLRRTSLEIDWRGFLSLKREWRSEVREMTRR